jgi:hypothetical protein
MAMDATRLLAALDGARMVVTAECVWCETFGVSYWNGAGTVNSMYWGEVLVRDVWTLYELESMAGWEVEQALREQLVADMCPCSAQVWTAA